MSAWFQLKCVLCGIKEERAAEDCHEMQYCNKCLGPMILLSVKNKPEKKQ